jgi:hypothetical protein
VKHLNIFKEPGLFYITGELFWRMKRFEGENFLFEVLVSSDSGQSSIVTVDLLLSYMKGDCVPHAFPQACNYGRLCYN